MAENNNQERLEIQIVAAMQQALAAINATNTELKQTTALLKTVKVSADELGNIKGINVTARELKATTKNTTELNASLSNTKKLLSVGFNLGKLYLLWNITKRIRDTIAGWVQSSIDFIETTNKFEVAMRDSSGTAYRFVDKITEAFGLARTQIMDFQATYKNIMSSLPRTN